MKLKALRKSRTPGKAKKVGLILGVILLALTVLGTMGLSTNTSKASKKYKATKEIVRDQATGQLRKPTPEETDAMVAQLSVLTNRSSAGLTSTQQANGTQKVDLQGRFGGVMLGIATADGGTSVRCVFTMGEAVEFLGLEEDQ